MSQLSSSSSLSEQRVPTKQSSIQTDGHVTQRVSHVNKMAEFYVSISPAPRTTPNIPSKDIKHIENTPSPSTDIIGDKDKSHSPDLELLLPIDDSEGQIDNPQPSDNKDHVHYPRDGDLEHSRSNNDRFSDMETDDEDLLAGMGSGYYSSTTPTARQHDRFAFEHDMFGGGNTFYDEAEKVMSLTSMWISLKILSGNSTLTFLLKIKSLARIRKSKENSEIFGLVLSWNGQF